MKKLSFDLKAQRLVLTPNPVVQLLFLISIGMTACAPPASNNVPPILLFNGTGTSANDVAAVETILKNRHLKYSTVNSRQLNGMSESQLMSYRLMIVPGGNFITIGDSLTSSTTANIHNAVQGGLNYLGICAGGFLAGHASYNSLNLTSGVRFDFYSDEERRQAPPDFLDFGAGAHRLGRSRQGTGHGVQQIGCTRRLRKTVMPGRIEARWERTGRTRRLAAQAACRVWWQDRAFGAP